MQFAEKPLFHVVLDVNRGETLEHLLVALAMASYEATPSFFEDGIGPDGVRATAMLNPDDAAKYVRGDELLMCYVKGKFCMTHVRRVRRHQSQIDLGNSIALEVVCYDGDAQKLFERADRILDWIVDGPAVETCAEPDVPFPLDMEFVITSIAYDKEAVA